MMWLQIQNVHLCNYIYKPAGENACTAHRYTQTCTHTFFVYSCNIFLRLHSDYLLISCSDCVSGPWWGPRGSGGSGREIDGIFLDGVFDQSDAQTKVILLLRCGHCLCQERPGEIKKLRLQPTRTSCPDLLFVISLQLKSSKTNKHDSVGGISSGNIL